MWEEVCNESALAFPRVVIPFQKTPEGNETQYTFSANLLNCVLMHFSETAMLHRLAAVLQQSKQITLNFSL